jgi:hypothetical protein
MGYAICVGGDPRGGVLSVGKTKREAVAEAVAFFDDAIWEGSIHRVFKISPSAMEKIEGSGGGEIELILPKMARVSICEVLKNETISQDQKVALIAGIKDHAQYVAKYRGDKERDGEDVCRGLGI